MKNKGQQFCLLCVLIVAVIFSGCSYEVQFFILNNSKQPITISYTLYEPHTHGVFVTNPTIYDFPKSTPLDYAVGNNVKYDTSTQTVTAQLGANEALLVGTEMNFTLSNPDDRERAFRYIEKLVIVKNGGDTLSYTNKMIPKLFRQFGNQEVGIRIN